MTGSRYVLGPVYLIPQLQVTNAGYVSNIFGTSPVQKSDYTATVGLGTQWLVRFGPKVYLRGTALPSYIWYARTPEARKLGWTANNALLLLFNRLTVQLTGNSTRASTTLNSETDRRVLQSTTAGGANFELGLTGHILLVGGASASRYRFENNPPLSPGVLPPPQQLDRTEEAAQGGVRYRFSNYFSLDAQVEKTRATFVNTPSFGDSETTGYLLGIGLDGPILTVHLSGGYREGTPYQGSGFPPYKTGTGSFAVGWKARPSLGFQVYGHRETQYSLFAPYYFENMGGASVSVGLGDRVSLRGFGELGTNQYPDAPEFPERRRDRVTTYGGGVSFEIIRRVSFALTGQETSYRSNISGFSRNILLISGGFTLQLSSGIAVKAGTP
ncbi:MAG: outer membrane beta-barrel protein [Thermoanaerobaculia bacterium]